MSLQTAIQDSIRSSGKVFITDIRQELRSAGKSATGSLIKQTKGVVSIKGDKIVFEGVAPDHWVFVDKGRRSGSMPPIKPISKWIKQRGLDLNPWAVAMSIKRKGIKPTNIYTDNIEKFKNNINIEDAVIKDISETINFN